MALMLAQELIRTTEQLRVSFARGVEELLLLPAQGSGVLVLLLLMLAMMAVLRLLPCLCRRMVGRVVGCPQSGHSSEGRPLGLRLVARTMQRSDWRIQLSSGPR